MAVVRIASVIGGRPHPMKVAPIHHAAESADWMRHIVLDFGYLDKLYAHETYMQLGLPEPVARYSEPANKTRSDAFDSLIHQAAEAIDHVKPDHLLIYGDVDASASAAIAARAAGVRFSHIEAGLRSHDYGDREEVNRLMLDRLADYWVTHSPDAVEALRVEAGGHGESVLVTASPAIETLYSNVGRARRDVASRLGLVPGTYCLCTVHRNETLANQEHFGEIMKALAELSGELPVVLLNYRSTQEVIAESFAGIDRQLTLVPTLSYLDYLGLLVGARVVITDSSGLQDEATALGIPTVVCRAHNHRVSGPIDQLVGFDQIRIIARVNQALSAPMAPETAPPLWHRPAGSEIVRFLEGHLRGS